MIGGLLLLIEYNKGEHVCVITCMQFRYIETVEVGQGLLVLRREICLWTVAWLLWELGRLTVRDSHKGI